MDLDGSLLPSPFTPTGDRPEGPAWYATPTVAYAVELGYDVTPDRGVRALRRTAATWTPGTTGCATPTSPRWPTSASHADLSPADFLAAMDGYKEP